MRVRISPLERIQELGGGVAERVVALAPHFDGPIRLAPQEDIAVLVREHLDLFRPLQIAIMKPCFNTTGGDHAL